MNRAPAVTDFPVSVEGVGNFVFARRNMRDELRIASEYSRLTEGVETPTNYLQNVATWFSVLKVLTVEAPHGWDLDAMDPFDDETLDRVVLVYAALRAKEGSFRSAKRADGKAPGQAESGAT